MLLLAFLPSLLYVGHWGEMVGVALGQPLTQHGVDGAKRVSHSAHCHFGQSTCSDQPAPLDAKVFPAAVELPKLELTARPVEDSDRSLAEVFLSPPTEPPQL